MFSIIAISTLLSLAAAQTIDINDPCAQQPAGYGPLPTPNTDSAFSAFSTFSSLAIAATAPPGYQRTFTNLNASQLFDPTTMVYLGYQSLPTYSASLCTALCDSTTGCVGTNLYFERDPTLNPAAACVNPAAMTAVKCALWGSPVTPDYAMNVGQWREQFHVVVAGSNGYFKLPAQACSAISAAYDGNGYSWPMGRVNWKDGGNGSVTGATATATGTVKAGVFKTVATVGAKAGGW